ncbi:MAG: glycoside hydrolase family 3 C-terminal domain-containing protein [Micropruina sp.]|uniref:glycoside hydrolase family 3 C-terminal domain-containing protein n=1 Tax=Micropruina sp. TaxID=2737536 RepID=UPI0039E4880C
MTGFDVDAVLAELTLAEKASLTSGSGFWWTAPIKRLGVPAIMMCDGPHGLRSQSAGGTGFANEADLTATCFPTASALASTWNPALLREIGAALAQEARCRRLSIILGPGLNLKRSPLCGRNFEYFSEDPLLAGELAIGMVEGIQAGGDIGASVKHYLANNSETDRQRIDVQVSQRALRELYLAGFERVITAAKPWTVMCSYNGVNGQPVSQNRWALTEVLRDEWGFEGVVVSDWGAVYDRVAALAAGTDLEMPPLLPHSPDALVAAVESGALDAALLDARARAMLELVAKGMGVLHAEETFDADAHHALARRAAAESIVLLGNDTGLLPLASGTRLALIGEFARTPRFQGAGSSEVNPTRVDTALDALRAEFPELLFAPGYTLPGQQPDNSAGAASLIADAVAAAGAAGVAIVLIGLPDQAESEGWDRTHLDLPADQLALLAEVAGVNPNLVVVLVNGAPVDLRPVMPHAAALVEAYLGGQASGAGLADVLTGRVNPAGRLAETIPWRLRDNPAQLNFPGSEHVVHYGEGIFVGYRGYDAVDVDVAFPFGFGLSYTTFAHHDLTVDVIGSAADDTLAATVAVTITNTGDRDGVEVVQVYLRDPVCSVERPLRELRGFARVAIAAGESSQVSVELGARAFAFFSQRFGRWVIEAGEFVVEVGRHSREIVLSQSIQIEAPRVAAPLTRLSTLFEWADDPAGRDLLAMISGDQGSSRLLEPDTIQGMGTQPMQSIAAFPSLGVDLTRLDAAVERLSASA